MDFIDKYIKFADPLTEASRVFHNYMAYIIVSQAIERKIFYKGAGSFSLSPCLWMIIIGPSSRTKKTTTIRIATEYILQEAMGPEKDFIYPAEGSHESFVELLSKQPHGLILHSEFSSFMNWLHREYNAALTPFLTQLYDQPTVYKRRVGTREKAKEYIIENPFINILACSTMEWFNEQIDSNRIRGGFFPRFILIPDEQHNKVIPETPEPNRALQNELVIEMQTLINLEGSYQAVYTEEAKKIYYDWYIKTKKYIVESDPIVSPFHDRRMTDVHKFAMIHAALRQEFVTTQEHNQRLLMNPKDLNDAIALVEQFFEYNEQIITEDLAFTRYEKNRNRVLEIIKNLSQKNGNKENGLPYWQLVNSSKMERRVLRDVIDNLQDEQTILVNNLGKSANGKNKVFYKINKQEVHDA